MGNEMSKVSALLLALGKFDKSAEAFDIFAEILMRSWDEQKIERTPPVDTTLMFP
jgi:hypothetical protein